MDSGAGSEILGRAVKNSFDGAELWEVSPEEFCAFNLVSST